MASTLYLLVQLMESEPGLRSSNPGFSPINNPQPRSAPERQTTPPYDVRLLVSASLDAVRLHQLADLASGDVKAKLLDGANYVFMESGANKLPASELFQLMLDNWPPPPPSHVVRHVESLYAMYQVQVQLEKDHPELHIPAAYKHNIEQVLFGALGHGAEGGGGGGSGGPSLKVKPVPIPVPRFDA